MANQYVAQITAGQLASLRSATYDRDAEALADRGAWLTYEQAEELGDAAMDWARSRLELTVDMSDDERVVLRPDSEVAS